MCSKLMQCDCVEIVADDREIPSGIPDRLRALPSISLRVRRLKVGDYVVENEVVVERKTTDDLCASIVDGRLFRQASSLNRSQWRPVFVIEGDISESFPERMNREAMLGALSSITIVFAIPVLFTQDCGETAQILIYSSHQLARRGTHSYRRYGRRPRTGKGRKLSLLQMLPGIGPDRAARLLDQFGSIERCFTANVSDLTGVHGIGKKTAEGIRRIVEEKSSGYFPLAVAIA